MTEGFADIHCHTIFRFFDVLIDFPLRKSKAMRDHYL